jgi:hypothetical protein
MQGNTEKLEREEDQIRSALAMDSDEIEEVEQEQEAGAEFDTSTLNATENEAWDTGWRPKDQFSGDPDSWKPARAWLEYGQMQRNLNDTKALLQRTTERQDTDIKNLAKMHQARLNLEIEKLKKEQLVKVSYADVDAYQEIGEDIKELESQREIIEPKSVAQTQSHQPAIDPLLSKWESENNWVYDDEDPRTLLAKKAFETFSNKNPNESMTNALRYVDSKVSSIYSKPKTSINVRREMVSTHELSRTSTARKPIAKGAVAWGDLSDNEKELWRASGSDIWGGDKTSFLDSVATLRKGEG